MGTARIIRHIAKGKYEVEYHYDNTAVNFALVDFKNTLIEIETKLLIEEAKLQVYTNIIETKTAELNTAIGAYKICTDDLSEGENPTQACKTEYEAIITLQVEIQELIKQTAPSRESVDSLHSSQVETKKLIELYELVPDKKNMDIWCIDCCDRAESEPLIGEWYGHALIIPDDTMVNTIEVWGKTGVREIRIDASAEFPAVPEHCIEPVLNHDKFGANYNWVMLIGQETWKPSFRVGTLKSIDKTDVDNITAKVTINVSQHDGTSLNDQLLFTHTAKVDYMGCGKGMPFKVDDIVVVKFDGNISTPTIIGYADNPKPCLKTYRTGYTFTDGDPFTGYTAYNIEKNIETGVWEVASNIKGLGTPQHWKNPYTDYVLGWMIAERVNNFIDQSYVRYRWAPYHQSLQVEGIWHNVGGSVSCACLDENNNIIVVTRVCNWNPTFNYYDHTVTLKYYTSSMALIGTIFNETHSSYQMRGDSFLADVTAEFIALFLAGSFNGTGTKIVGRVIGFDITLNLTDYTIQSIETDGSGVVQPSDQYSHYWLTSYGNVETSTSARPGYGRGFGMLKSNGEAVTICPETDIFNGEVLNMRQGFPVNDYSKFYSNHDCVQSATNHNGMARTISQKSIFMESSDYNEDNISYGTYYDYSNEQKAASPYNDFLSFEGYMPWEGSSGTLEETYTLFGMSLMMGQFPSTTTRTDIIEDANGVLLNNQTEMKGKGFLYLKNLLYFIHIDQDQDHFCLKGFDGEYGYTHGLLSYYEAFGHYYYFSGTDLDELIPTLKDSTNHIYLLGVYLIPDV